jgi:hypothetical protein
MRPVAIIGLLSAALALVAGTARVSPALRLMAARRDAVHSHARVRFPERSGGFVRTEVTRFDREGLDVAAHYAIRGYSFTRILATLYVYPVTPQSADLREEFERRRRELEAAKPATFVTEKEVRLGRSGLEARYAAYALQSGTVLEGGPEQSVLVVARWGSWWIKWRVTAPDIGEGRLPAAALQLIEELTPSQDPPSEAHEEADEEQLAWALPVQGATSTYAAVAEGSGIGKRSSRRPLICMSMASRMCASVSSGVAPVATQPGRSGEYAEKFPFAFSTTIRKRRITLPSTPLAQGYS